MNNWSATGRLVKDAELRRTASGESVASFTLAIRRRNKKDEADFVPCIVWGKTADALVNHVKKGNLIGVTGRIQTRNYESNGRKVYVTEAYIDTVEFLEKKDIQNAQKQAYNNAQPQYDTYSPDDIDPSDLPF